MNDNIIFNKIWQDDNLIELKTTCTSAFVTVVSKIYVSDSLLDNLCFQIEQFLNNNIEEGLWANEKKGDDSVACLSLRFFRKDNLGHISIEVFAEIDDGSSYTDHNCCFFISTEYGLLMRFCEKLSKLKEKPEGTVIQLNRY